MLLISRARPQCQSSQHRPVEHVVDKCAHRSRIMGERFYQGQPRFGIAQSMRRTCRNISFIQKLPVTGFRAEYVTSIEPSMACFDGIAKVRRPSDPAFGSSEERRVGNECVSSCSSRL